MNILILLLRIDSFEFDTKSISSIMRLAQTAVWNKMASNHLFGWQIS